MTWGVEANKLVNTKARRNITDVFEWDPTWRGDLASACSGGQWPQVRRAKVAREEIDLRCQLCKAAIGTLSHRFECTATAPSAGWPGPPREADLARGKMTRERLEVMQNRGLLLARVPAPPEHEGEWFKWLVSPPDDDLDGDYVWYLDGFILHAKWNRFGSTGYGIVVTGGGVC